MRKRKDPLLIIGIAAVVGLALFAILYPVLGPDPLKTSDTSFAPSWISQAWEWVTSGFDREFRFQNFGFLGTDELGRDILARLAYGARISLFVGFIVQTMALMFGIFIGTLGVFGTDMIVEFFGWLRLPVPRRLLVFVGNAIRVGSMRFTDGMFAFPDILLAMLIIGVWSMGVLPVIVALAVGAWPGVARLVASQLASLKDREYVVAARAAGASTFYIVVKHVLPQLWGILLAVSMVDLAGTILAESTLSFLGIGVQAPTPSWGSMINNARGDMNSHPIMLLWPCLILSGTIFALNFVGDGLRARFDPKTSS